MAQNSTLSPTVKGSYRVARAIVIPGYPPFKYRFKNRAFLRKSDGECRLRQELEPRGVLVLSISLEEEDAVAFHPSSNQVCHFFSIWVLYHIGSELPKVFFWALLLTKTLFLALFRALLKVPILLLELYFALFCCTFFGGTFLGTFLRFLFAFFSTFLGTFNSKYTFFGTLLHTF